MTAFRLGANRAISAAQLASSEAGATSRLGLCSLSGLAFEHQQQRQDLDGLAEPHVVREAGPESQLGEQMQPLHARRADRAAACLAGPAGVDAREPVGTAQARPASRASQGPATVWLQSMSACAGGAIAGNAGTGQHAHRLAERQAIVGGAALDRLELLERAGQPLMVDLDPLAADEGQSVGLRKQPLDLGRRQAFAVERHLHLEVEQRIAARAATAPCRRRSPSPAGARAGSCASSPACARPRRRFRAPERP